MLMHPRPVWRDHQRPGGQDGASTKTIRRGHHGAGVLARRASTRTFPVPPISKTLRCSRRSYQPRRLAKLSLRELQGLDYLPELLHLMIAWQKKVDRLAKQAAASRRPLRRPSTRFV